MTTYTDNTPEDAIDAINPDEWVTTGEVAERIDTPRRTVLEWLQNAHAEDRVRRRQPNQRLYLWSRDD